MRLERPPEGCDTLSLRKCTSVLFGTNSHVRCSVGHGEDRSSDPEGMIEQVREAERRVARGRHIVHERWRELVQCLELLEKHERGLELLKSASTERDDLAAKRH
jgi:hypothetical protein